MKQKASLFFKSIGLVKKSAPGWTTLNIILSLVSSFLPLLLIWLIKKFIDAVTFAVSSGNEDSIRMALWIVLAIAIVYFLDEALQSMANLVRKRQSLGLESYMFDILHKKSVSLDLQHFEDPDYYDTLSRASREAPYRPGSIVNNIVSFARGSISLILMGGLLAGLNVWLVVILVVANIPGIWLRIHFADILYNFKKDLTPVARKASYFNWLLTGDRASRELRLFGLGDYFSGLFKKNFDEQKTEEIWIIRKRSIVELVTGLFKALAVFVTLYYILRETTGLVITIGDMAMYLLAFRLGLTYIKQMLASTAGLYEDNLFISDVFEFLDLKENVTARSPVITLDKLEKSIRIENLSFNYSGSENQVLSNIDLEINKGETLALVGPNGAGKSTLVRLLTRLYDPEDGKILFDGKDIRNTDPHDYRKIFSVVFQDFMLYNMSVTENITAGDIDKSIDKVKLQASASLAGIHSLIEELPKGYETVIGRLFDESRELSWGEWQKIALARALYRQSPVLILDEPASALDAQSEYELFKRFRDIAADRTCILISHNFSNVSIADRIVVLDKGKITETGSHEALMTKGGDYCRLYNQQKSRYV